MNFSPLRACESCEQGKHVTCLVDVWDDSVDDWVKCPCYLAMHSETIDDGGT